MKPNVLLVIFAALLFVAVISEGLRTPPTPPCQNYIVKTILKVEHRTVTVELENGKQVDLYSTAVKPGDQICN